MRATWFARWLIAVAAVGFTAAPSIGNTAQQVRGRNPESQQLLDEVIEASPTVARLVHEIDQHDVIVIVELGELTPDAHGELTLAAVAHEWRYLWIRLADGAPFYEMGGRLAHELQHALEVASHENVRNQEDMVRLFGRIGMGPTGGPYETYEALAAGRDVRRELWGMSPPKPAAPPAAAPHGGREPVETQAISWRRRVP